MTTAIRNASEKVSLPAMTVMGILAVLLAWDACGMFIHLLRVTILPGVPVFYAAMNGAMLVALSAIVAISTLNAFLTGRRPPPGLLAIAAAMVLLLVYGVAISVLRHQPFGRPYVGHLYYWVIMFLGFTVAYGTRWTPAALQSLGRLLAMASYAIVTCSSLGLVVLELYRRSSGATIYAGYPGSPLILPAVYFAHRRKWVALLLTLTLMLLTGKRGPMLGAVAALIYLAIRGSISRKLVVAIAVAAFIPLLTSLATYAVESEILPPDSAAARVISKWMWTMSEIDDGGLGASTGGRDQEVEEAWHLINTRSGLWLGQGYGWSIIVGTIILKRVHFVHLSYLNTLVTYGLIGSIPFFIVAFWSVRSILRAARLHGSELLSLIGVVILATAVTGLTVNQMNVSIQFWMFAGVGLHLAHRYNAAARVSRKRRDPVSGPAVPPLHAAPQH